MKLVTGWAIAAAALATAMVAQAATPPLVAAYVEQLTQQCPGPANPNLVDRVDLNGDGVEDYVIDAARRPCPGRPEAFTRFGSPVTVFLGRKDGLAYPALQRNAHGAHLDRRPDGKYRLSLDLSGSDCGEDASEARCSRDVLWRAKEGRLDLVAPETTKR